MLPKSYESSKGNGRSGNNHQYLGSAPNSSFSSEIIRNQLPPIHPTYYQIPGNYYSPFYKNQMQMVASQGMRNQPMYYEIEGPPQIFNQNQSTSPPQHKKTHRKTKSLPSKSSSKPLINKFQSNSSYVTSHGSGSNSNRHSSTSSIEGGIVSESLMSNKILFPVKKIPKVVNSIPQDKMELLTEKINPSIEVKKYSTSAIDPIRNYLTVFEYSVNNHWIIWDYETGFVHLTGIWKAAISARDYESNLNIKADIVKLLDSTPKKYHASIKRIRGGFLKIQGTWLPFSLCRILCRRFSYYIRFELVPIFGVDFPDYCLHPDDAGFGELRLDEITNENTDIVENPPTPKTSPTYKQIKSQSYLLSPANIKSVKSDRIGKSEHSKNKRNSLPSILLQQPNSLHHKDKKKPILECTTPTLPPLTQHPATSPARVSHRENLEYHDMLDIVNASKCLQSLSKSNSSNQYSDSISPISTAEDNYILLPRPNYVATSAAPNSTSYDSINGISSILLAAGISERKKSTYNPINRHSMKIDDLLS